MELFIANTWTAASTNIETLDPERQDTYEAAADWRLSPGLNLRANAWLAVLDDEIGYDTAEDEIINRYDDVRAGGVAIGGAGAAAEGVGAGADSVVAHAGACASAARKPLISG